MRPFGRSEKVLRGVPSPCPVISGLHGLHGLGFSNLVRHGQLDLNSRSVQVRGPGSARAHGVRPGGGRGPRGDL